MTAGEAASRVTLQDVADRAGVSLTTASRVVNEGSRRVGQKFADRARVDGAELLRYWSARSPGGACIAVLTCAAFAETQPQRGFETWRIG